MTHARSILCLVILAASVSTASAQGPTTNTSVGAAQSQPAPVEAAVTAQQVERYPDLGRFQFGAALLGDINYMSGRQSEGGDLPSYAGVGAELHLGAVLVQGRTSLGNRLSLTAGYRGTIGGDFGIRALDISNDLLTHRHQAVFALGFNRVELLVGGGAVFSHFDGHVGRGGNVLFAGRFGTASGVYVAGGIDMDIYTNVYVGSERGIGMSCFLAVGWKNER